MRSGGIRLADSLLLAAVVLVAALSFCSSRLDRARERASISFGALPGSVPLVYIASDRGYFAATRLQVSVKEFPTGAAAIDALSKGDLDVAWSAEFPLVRRAFAEKDISIIASTGKFGGEYLFGRKDRGIRSIPDLRGKKIGVPRNTIGEFYLGRFLELNGLSMREVSIVDVQPAHFMDAAMNGSVDAVVAFEPYSSEMRARQAGTMVAWSVQSSQPGYGIVAARSDWIRKHPQIVVRFLRSLAQADDYMVHHPRAGRDNFQRHAHYSDAVMATCWPEYTISLSLDESLIAAMEDEARWSIRNNRTRGKAVPDFRKSLYLDGLRTVKPDAVNVIR